jgi:hypothetical protein
VSCGEKHALVLVSSCCCDSVKLGTENEENCGGILKCNRGTEIFGWGDNSQGQIIASGTEISNIPTPVLLNYFSGKRIVGIRAWK